ncbi:hypothetical protein LJ737_13915 [Hymenobacter sp. 15J16-1T3B]|uniref:hypothetical protein n=1 Tax=Hymenobacter sp. 15J16-1T3B TaxID=2886941 RepID=UPI001D11BB23|nr:hypothetical protein [Hymenobacter sp. 15J16-1T3B]MCC3158340.1 hypothetical protein [Hymenobacter sp. 15J16-1T3B]
MEADFQTYQKYPTLAATEPLLALLQQHDVSYRLQEDRATVEPAFAFNEHDRSFLVKLRPADFARADVLQDEANAQLVAATGPEHYLFGFSNEELMDLLVHPDEWSRFDVLLAQRLLRERGQPVSPDTVRLLEQRRHAELNKPPEKQTAWVMLGYVSALLGGLLGLAIGWHLYAHRRRLTTGQLVPAFAAEERVHGLRIVALGVVSLVTWVGLQLYFGGD